MVGGIISWNTQYVKGGGGNCKRVGRFLARDAAGQSIQKRAPDAVASRPYFVRIAQPLIPQKGGVAIAKREVVGNLKFEWKTQPLIPRKERFQNCEAGGNCKRGEDFGKGRGWATHTKAGSGCGSKSPLFCTDCPAADSRKREVSQLPTER